MYTLSNKRKAYNLVKPKKTTSIPYNPEHHIIYIVGKMLEPYKKYNFNIDFGKYLKQFWNIYHTRYAITIQNSRSHTSTYTLKFTRQKVD